MTKINKVLWLMDSPTLLKDAFRIMDGSLDKPQSDIVRNAVIANLAGHGVLAIELLDTFEQRYGPINYTDVSFFPRERHHAMALCCWLISKKNRTVFNALCNLIGAWGVETEADYQWICAHLGDLLRPKESSRQDVAAVGEPRSSHVTPAAAERFRGILREAAVGLAGEMAKVATRGLDAQEVGSDYPLAILLDQVGGSIPARHIELMVAKRITLGPGLPDAEEFRKLLAELILICPDPENLPRELGMYIGSLVDKIPQAAQYVLRQQYDPDSLIKVALGLGPGRTTLLDEYIRPYLSREHEDYRSAAVNSELGSNELLAWFIEVMKPLSDDEIKSLYSLHYSQMDTLSLLLQLVPSHQALRMVAAMGDSESHFDWFLRNVPDPEFLCLLAENIAGWCCDFNEEVKEKIALLDRLYEAYPGGAIIDAALLGEDDFDFVVRDWAEVKRMQIS